MNMFIMLLLAGVASLAAAGIVDRGQIVPQKVGSIHIIADKSGHDIRRLDADRILRMSRDELLRQKFLLDVLQQVQQPLANDQILRLADTLIVDQDRYNQRLDDEMLHVIELARNKRLLGKDEIFTITDEEHLRQMVGIYRLLVSARDWDTLQRNVAHIRRTANGVLLVNALLLAVRDRADTQRLIVPGLHEILAELYNDVDVVRRVQQIDLSHLTGEMDSVRPGLRDVIGLGQRTRLMNAARGIEGRLGDGNTGGVGIGALDRTQLWMPWRDMHDKIRSQQGDELVVAQTQQRVGQTTDDTIHTLLTEDLGLKAFVHGLVNDLILQDSQLQREVGGIDAGHREQIMGGRVDDERRQSEIEREDRLARLGRTNRWDDQDVSHEGRMDIDRNERIERLDDVLPSAHINDDRLLHVNRRRLQTNAVQGNQGSDIGSDRRTLLNDQRHRLVDGVRGGRGVQDGRVVDLGLDRDIVRSDMRDRWNLDEDIRGGQRRLNIGDRDDDVWSMRGRNELLGRNERQDRLGEDIKLDDTLPTASIDDERLLHVNRRRLQANRGSNMGDRRSLLNDQRHRFLNVVRGGGGVRDGRQVMDVVDSIDRRDRWSSVQGIGGDQRRVNIHDRDDDMIMGQRSDRWAMKGRRNDHDDDDDDDEIIERRRDLLNRGIDLDDQNRRTMHDMDMLNRRRVALDRDMDGSDNLPTASIDNGRLVHVNRRRLNQKISMQENQQGQQQLHGVHDRLDIQRGRGLGNIRETIVGSVRGGRIHDGRRTVSRQDDSDVQGRRRSIRRNNGQEGRAGGRWQKDTETGDDDQWRQRSDDDQWQMLRRGMENIRVGQEQDNDMDQWQRKHAGLRRDMTDDEDDESELMGVGMRRRVPRSLDHLERDVRGGGDVQNTRHIMEQLRGGEVLLHNLQQLIARMNLETMALGISDVQGDIMDNIIGDNIPAGRRQNSERLAGRVDEMHALRMNEMRLGERRDRQLLGHISDVEQRLGEVIRQEIGRIGGVQHGIGARDTSIINGIIGDILLGKVDRRINLLSILRDLLHHGVIARGVPTISDVGVAMQSPVVRLGMRRIMRLIDVQRQQLLGQYRRDDLTLDGVEIVDVTVDKLRTRVDEIDSDLINLLDARVNLADNQALLQRRIVGRQQRLTHKAFNIDIELTSDRSRSVVVRTLLVPKVDAGGRALSVDQQRLNAIVLDAQLVKLITGRNLIKRQSKDIEWTAKDTTPLTELYQRVLSAIGGAQDATNNHSLRAGGVIGQTGRFPHRLLLPRGQIDGLPMQLLVIVSGVEDIDRNIQQISSNGGDGDARRGLLSGLGVASQNLDRLPLRFPLDRPIDSIDQLQALSNVHLKDVQIFHEDHKLSSGQVRLHL